MSLSPLRLAPEFSFTLYLLAALIAFFLAASASLEAEPLVDESPVAPARAEPGKQSYQSLEAYTVGITRLPITLAESPLPVDYFGREELRLASSRDVGTMIRDLTLSSGGSFNPQLTVGTAPGTTAVSLRGLGAENTLILLDGRRLLPFALAQNYFDSFVDLSSLPLSIIDHVEISKDGGSAQYGSDAAAGIINLHLKNYLYGSAADFRLSQSTQGDLGEVHFSAASGFEFGQWQGLLAYNGSRQDGINQDERSFSESSNQEPRGGQDKRSVAGPDPSLFFVLPFGPQLAVPDSAYADAAGLSPVVDPMTNAFNYNPYVSLIPESERHAAYLVAERPLSERILFRGSLLYSSAETQTNAPPPSTAMTGPLMVAAGNPYNPLAAPVLAFVRILEGPDKYQITTSQFVRALLEMEGRLDAGWEWESGLLAMRSLAELHSYNEVRRDLFQDALNSADPATAYNPFGEWTGGPNVGADQNAALIQGMLTETERSGSSQMLLGDLTLNGPLLEDSTLFGEVALAVGAEAWQERFKTENDPLDASGQTFSPTGAGVSGRRDVVASFAEMTIEPTPELLFLLAGRAERYSDFGGTVNPKLAASWLPDEKWSLRASWGTGFRAPSLSQLFSGTVSYPLGVYDPLQDRDIRPLVHVGGNDDLEPEVSETWAVGLDYQLWQSPEWEVQLGIDWSSVQIEDVILSDAQFILDHEANYPGAVLRDAAGAAQSVTALYENLGVRQTEAFDFSAELAWNYSDRTRLVSQTTATWLYQWKEQSAPGADWIDLAGYEYSKGRSYPEWRLRSTLRLEMPDWLLAATLNYIHDYKQFHPAVVRSKIEAWTGVDLLLEHQLNDALRIRVGVDNVFDAEPPFINYSPGYDWATHDATGRYVYLQFSYSR
jgi:outer membrane receptor for ferrienterochelin and colicin